MSEIKPALTPEQWREALPLPPGVVWGFGKASSGEISRHAMAAICLYGQPFGFTREMLRAIREMYDFYASYAHAPPERPTFAVVESAMDNIEALLPPEKSP